jgi:prefoldin subunit 5
MNPVTSATVSGLGQTPLGMVEGTWVVGFFQDADEAQQPIIIGTLPGVPSSLPTKGAGKGFQDRLNANYPKYTETDVNRLAVNDADNPHPSLTIRQADRTTSIGRADFNPIDIGRANAPAARSLPGDDGTNFNEPATTYKSQYPYNHVYESEAGHIKEFDDTPNSERIHERHSTGTGYEINEFGDKVQRVKRDNYEIISNDHFAHIKGTHNTTVDGGVRVFVNANATADSNYTIQVGSNANVNVQVDKGNINLIATQGEINMKAEDMNIDITKDFRVKAQSVNFEVNGSLKEVVTGTNTKTGNPINLN